MNDLLQDLNASQSEHQPERARLALTILYTLTHIDYDLIVPSIPRIISRLLFVCTYAHCHPRIITFPSRKVTETAEALKFLNFLLDYHTKTRTMNIYISTLLSAISSTSSPPDAKKTYAASFASPLLSLAHLDRLSKCTQNFVTSGQTQDIVIGVVNALKHTWDLFWQSQQRFIVNRSERSRKKHKTTAEELSDHKTDDPNACAVACALLARISSTVLSSISLQSLPESTRLDIQQTLAEAQASYIRVAQRQAFELIGNNLRNPGRDIWGCQVGAAALLRLEYSLIAARQLCLRAQIDDKLSTTMLDVAGDDEALPELGLEIVRIALLHDLLDSSLACLKQFRMLLSSSTEADADSGRSHEVLERLLQYLERHYAAMSWSGLSCHLTFGRSGQGKTAVALLHWLIDRSLHAIE